MESLILTLLVILPGVWCGDWRVTFANQCVLKGASVVMKCEYDYPFGHIVTSGSWSKRLKKSGRWTLLPLSSLYSISDRYKYVGNRRGNCDLQISDVQLTDEGSYFFSFVTTFSAWTSQTSAFLSVKELTAVVQPNSVTEGDRVRLTCESGCSDPVDIIWYRDGQPVLAPDFLARRLHAGSYHCAVLGQQKIRSNSVTLSVQYAPEDVGIYFSPQANIIQGSSVTLACGSNAKPLVKPNGYSLFQDGEFFSSGRLHIISNIQPSHSGWYHCQAWNGVSRGGSDRFNSARVHLDVQYLPGNISVSVTPQHMVEGSSVNMTCSSDANPAAHSYTWYKWSDSGSLLRAGSGPLLSLPSVQAADTGFYFCEARNRVGVNNSTEVLLTLEMEHSGIKTVSALAGIGVSLVVTLLIALLLFWRKRRTSANNKFDMRLTGRGSQPFPAEDPSDAVYANIHMAPSDAVYANIHMAPSSPPPDSAVQENPHSQVNTEHSRTSPVTCTVKTTQSCPLDFLSGTKTKLPTPL
ncbi:unnamed protein product [Ophioblennius macclurei]